MTDLPRLNDLLDPALIEPDLPTRPRDRYDALIAEWERGCIKCGAEPVTWSLPESHGRVGLPLCRMHVRWAMACRRERIGKQAGQLRRLLSAWCRLRGGDSALMRTWLGY